jgi:hypothetical protein
MYPKRYQSYTLEEICNVLKLRDNPALGFTYQNIGGCIQDSHLTSEELLSVPGMKESKWVYIRETHEWIPCFKFDVKADQPDISTLVDVELYDDIYNLNKEPMWWATPKGFPRKQHE